VRLTYVPERKTSPLTIRSVGWLLALPSVRGKANARRYTPAASGNAAAPLLATSRAYRPSASNFSARLVNTYTVAPRKPNT
jgi:hypothetical protein